MHLVTVPELGHPAASQVSPGAEVTCQLRLCKHFGPCSLHTGSFSLGSTFCSELTWVMETWLSWAPWRHHRQNQVCHPRFSCRGTLAWVQPCRLLFQVCVVLVCPWNPEWKGACFTRKLTGAGLVRFLAVIPLLTTIITLPQPPTP